MARFFTWLSLSALAAIAAAATPNSGAQPQMLSLERQQELLDRLAQLQRETQQLLAQQASLAALAGVNPPHHAQPASAPAQTIPKAQVQQAQQNRQASKPKPKPQPVQQAPKIETHNQGSAPPLPQQAPINWGKCPELEPSEPEKLAKAAVITKCLENTPLPANITRESVEHHREQIAACALRAEGWFTTKGGYDYTKAEKEIKNKRMQKPLEEQVLSYHSQCKAESEEKYPSSSGSIIAQIQLYQACMDYFISDVCGIEVLEADPQ